MSTTALIDGFRQLRPVVRDWLARDLASTPGHEPTRAYADLTLAFGFARLGAADDAKQCANDAESILGQSADESHGWLLLLYRYRIDEALRGNRHGGIVPDGVRSPNAAETQQRAAGDGNATGGREVYVTDQFLTQSRVLDPEECTDPYRAWTKNLSARRRTGEVSIPHRRGANRIDGAGAVEGCGDQRRPGTRSSVGGRVSDGPPGLSGVRDRADFCATGCPRRPGEFYRRCAN